MEIPEEFIDFKVPGHEKQMEQIRAIYYEAYMNPVATPGASFIDVWAPVPLMSVAPIKKDMMSVWKNTFLTRRINKDGYVTCNQHFSHALDDGWPFPLFPQIQGDYEGITFGFLFQDSPSDITMMLAPSAPALDRKGYMGEKAAARWTVHDMENLGVIDDAWQIKVTGPDPWIETKDGFFCDAFCCPFISFRAFVSTDKPMTATLQWQRKGDKGWSRSRSATFDLQTPDPFMGSVLRFCTVEPSRSKEWNGTITKLRIRFPSEEGLGFAINSVFSAFNTRHQMNACNFLIGSINTFNQTGDTEFLKANIERMRKVFRYAQKELYDSKAGMIRVRYQGHDGIPGYVTDENGDRTYNFGHSIGGNYWDILPFGNLETYTSYYYVYTLRQMAALEEYIAANPQLGLGKSPMKPESMRREADIIVKTINARLWNPDTGRFYAAEDVNGDKWDFGFTFLNTEAIYYGAVTPDHAREIMDWIDGRRTVESDTSKGEDIYRWRLAPRATTLRNDKWYFWAWDCRVFPFGLQVQDGGAVFAQSFNDMMSRIRVYGPSNAWQRFEGILDWYTEVQEAGGYRAYYADGSKGNTMQGSGTAGGIGIDMEFVETVLVPYTMIEGFMGFKANPEGFAILPNLPDSWPSYEITGLRYRNFVMDLKASADIIEISAAGPRETLIVTVPDGFVLTEGKSLGGNRWQVELGGGRIAAVRRP